MAKLYHGYTTVQLYHGYTTVHGQPCARIGPRLPASEKVRSIYGEYGASERFLFIPAIFLYLFLYLYIFIYWILAVK